MFNRKTKIYLTSLLLILLLCLILNSSLKKISENGYCIPKQKIVFHKTHKCSTTTVQNILLRYAKKHSLHLALPNEGYFLGEPEGFSEKFHTENSILHNIFKPDIFCLTSRWNGIEVQKLFAPEIPFYFTILRDPVDVFISAWDYTNASQLFFNGKEIEDFVMSDNDSKPDIQLTDQIHLNNTMMWDFGLRSNQSENISAIKQKIKEIETTFGLVMIMEYFEESIVLLKDQLCWQYDDLIYLKLNVQKGQKSSLSTKAQEKLRKWLTADQMLYDHFKGLFLQKIKSFGQEQMNTELSKLDRSIEDHVSKCDIRQNENQFTGIRSPLCMDSIRPEEDFIDELRITEFVRAEKFGIKVNIYNMFNSE